MFRTRATCTALALAICATGSLALLQSRLEAQGGVIYACVINGVGQVRVVGANDPCKSNETKVEWNVVGPKGDKGDKGDTGGQGIQGIQGPPGPPANPGSIVGQLQTCQPTNLTGALVYVPGRAFSVFTGATGGFQIDNVPPGTYDVVVERNNAIIKTVTGQTVGTGTLDVGDILISDVQSDNNNCGACGISCGGGAHCSAGQCVPTQTCQPGAPCFTGQLGICAQGVVSCSGGGAVCVSVGPQPEMCNGLDDDCDGLIDEGFGVGSLCQSQSGNLGVLICNATGTGVVCTAGQ